MVLYCIACPTSSNPRTFTLYNALYKIDLDRYLVTGDSAGGQLTITTTMGLVRDEKKRKMPLLAAPKAKSF